MLSIASWIGFGAAALLGVAVAVAWWEHLARQAGRAQGNAQAAEPAKPRLVQVDVALDALAALGPPAAEGDSAARREALDGALGRMALAGANAESRRAWIDTAPMIGPGLRAETAPYPSSAAN
jgi:hypothetical protein